MASGYSDPVIRNDDKPIDPEELQSIVTAALKNASNYIKLEIAPQRIEAMKRYKGELYGDEQDGRSKVISRDVRDTVKAILPSLMKVFFSSEHVVEFVPRTKEAVGEAEQATDYIRYIFNEENEGFLTLYAAFKDALINKSGVLKWNHEEITCVRSMEYSGLDEMQKMALLADPEVTDSEVEQYDDPNFDPQGIQGQPTNPGMGAQGMPPSAAPQVAPQIPQLFDVKVTRKYEEDRFTVTCLAPEEFLVNRNATSIKNADLVAHQSLVTASSLMEMGYTDEEVDSVPGVDFETSANDLERIERHPSGLIIDEPNNPAMRKILHTEAFIKIDTDGDGIAELRRVCCLGREFKVIRNYPADEAPFAILCPEPEPHEVFGTSVAEIVMDIQRISSQIQRGMLDSLAQAITPTTAIVEGQVNISDVLNNEVGGIIRMRQLGMAQPFERPFLGQNCLPVLAFYNDMKQSRTGMSNASQGLDADALQSTTRAAVQATVDAAKQHIELIARIFAETGIKPMFKGLLRLVTKHQDKAKMLKLRGEWVEVNPSRWDPMMDVSVNVGLASQDTSERIDTLKGIAEKQEAILLQTGPGNPIVAPHQYAMTLRKIVELSGFPDADMFFSMPTPDQEKKAADAASQKGDPQQQAAQMLAQVQAQEIQADMKKKAAELELQQQRQQSDLSIAAHKLQLDERKMMMEDARIREQMMINQELQLKELELKYSANLSAVAADIHMNEAQIESQHQMAAMQPAGGTQ